MRLNITGALDQRSDIEFKIKLYEFLGNDYYNKDVENDPPSKMLMPDDVDYLYKKHKFKHFICMIIVKLLRKMALKKYKIVVENKELLNGFKGPAIITSNHFDTLESGCVSEVVKVINKKKKLHIVIREGNYSFTGLNGFLFRYGDTLPLSSNLKTMRYFYNAIEEIIKKEEFILIYPEQSMWWNYKKPRPQKNGAAFIANKFNVPVINCFVTLKNQDKFEGLYLLKQYTVHILNIIYPNPDLCDKENINMMTNQNYQDCVDMYEKTYQTKLIYDGK